MEELKGFEDILQPDGRQEAFCVINRASGEVRPLTMEDIYRNAAGIKLHDGVPEDVRSHFATAKNLMVYSWFFYPFNVTAQFLAFVTVEFALKERLKPKGKTSFKKLLKAAVEQGLIKNEGFSHLRGRSERDEYPEPRPGTESQQVKSYTEILIDAMPYLRNELAHGSPMLYPDGASFVRICAEFINQLFPQGGG